MDTSNNPSTMTRGSYCNQCGIPLETSALAGLCPACLLKQGAAADTATATQHPPFQPPAVEELAPVFPQLQILELIGKGGMGAVYKARQSALGRFVALKLLPGQVGTDPAFSERFNREARALARLNHPNIVGVYEFGTAGGFHFFLMEFVDGVNLRQLEKNRQLSPREALQIVAQICDALQYAHDEGIVHRDIKPENVLLDRRGRLKIADFGLAKLLDAPPADARLTAEDQIMGTPHYMAPEQVERPREVDHRADIYSLGVVFYELLTGELPLGKFPPPSRKVQVDVRLDNVVLRTLEKQPELRYQHAGEVKTAVENIAGTPAAAGAPPQMAQASPPASPGYWRYLKNRVWPPLVVRRSGQRSINWPAFAMRLTRGVLASLGGSAAVAVTTAKFHPYGIMAGFFPVWAIGFAALLALIGLVMAIRLLRGFAMPLDLIPEMDTAPSARTVVISGGAGHPRNNEDASRRRFYGQVALGLGLASTLGTLLLMTLSSRHELALIFGGLALVLALVFGIMGWRDRLGKGVVVAILSLLGLGIVAVIASGAIYFLRSSSAERERQAALAAQKRIVENAKAGAVLQFATMATNPQPDYIQAEATLAAMEVFGNQLEAALENKDQTNAAKYMAQFAEQLLSLNRLVRGTDVEIPTNRVTLALNAQDAIKAGDLTLATSLFEAAMAITPGDDDYPEKISNLAAQQRQMKGIASLLEPPVECDLRSIWSETNCLLDLDSGRVLSPPKELLAAISQEVVQKRVLMALLPRHREGKLWQWLEEGGADLVCGDGADNLLWLNGYVLGQTLDQSNSVKVLAAFQKFRTHAKDYAAATTNAQYYNNAWLNIPWLHRAASNYCVLFKTRENRFGLLQVIGPLTNPPGVKIRYRLLRDAAIPELGPDQPDVLTVTFAETVNHAHDEVLLANGIPATSGGSEPKPGLISAPPPFDQEAAELKLKFAELELKDNEEKSKNGLIPRQEYVKAKFAREIAAAELKQNAVEVARLKMELAEAELKYIEQRFNEGLVPRMDYERAKVIRGSAAAAYDRLKHAKLDK